MLRSSSAWLHCLHHTGAWSAWPKLSRLQGLVQELTLSLPRRTRALAEPPTHMCFCCLCIADGGHSEHPWNLYLLCKVAEACRADCYRNPGKLIQQFVGVLGVHCLRGNISIQAVPANVDSSGDLQRHSSHRHFQARGVFGRFNWNLVFSWPGEYGTSTYWITSNYKEISLVMSRLTTVFSIMQGMP